MSSEQEFVMPQTNPGMQILWYKKGYYDRTSMEVGYMLHTGERTAVIMSSSGRRAEAVRHIDDPKLQLNADQRENGAWDFTDDHRDNIKFKAEIRARLDAVEAYIRELKEEEEGPPVPAPRILTPKGIFARTNMQKYQALRQHAKSLGITIPYACKAMDIQAMIDAVNQGTPADEVTPPVDDDPVSEDMPTDPIEVT